MEIIKILKSPICIINLLFSINLRGLDYNGRAVRPKQFHIMDVNARSQLTALLSRETNMLG